MIIKTFTAETAAAALKKVRTDMGGDAVVLKTRQIDGASGAEKYEITACLDKASVAQTSKIFAPDTPTPVVPVPSNRLKPEHLDTGTPEPATPGSNVETRLARIEQRLELLLRNNSRPRYRFNDHDTSLQDIYHKLTDADLSEDYIEELFLKVLDRQPELENAEDALSELIAEDSKEIISEGLTLQPGDRVAVIGSTGSGKTSVIGKLAANLVLQNKKVQLVSLDNYKVGASEEIASYGDLLGVEVADYTEDSLRHADKEAIVLIDTPSMPRQEDKIREMVTRLEKFNPKYRLLVVSALSRTADVKDLSVLSGLFRPTHLVATMLDLTPRTGSIITAVRTLKTDADKPLKLVYTTDAPSGIGAIHPPDPARLCEGIYKTEVNREHA